LRTRRLNHALLWQAALIVLPVAVLSGVALHFLRVDKASVEQDARERAQILAPEMARDLGRRVGEALGAAAMEGEIAGGKIKSPADYPRLPEPPDWPNELAPEQSQLWNDAQEALYVRQDPAAAVRAFRLLANSKAPAAARATAEYNLLLLTSGAQPPERHGPLSISDVNEATIGRARTLASRSWGLLTDSGAPVSDLALLFALRRMQPLGLGADFFLEVRAGVRGHPSFLTPELLDGVQKATAGSSFELQMPSDGPEPLEEAQKYAIPPALRKPDAIGRLRSEWAAREQNLALLRALLRESGSRPAAETWLESGGQSFLALVGPLRDGYRIHLLPAAAVEKAFAPAATWPALPKYAVIAIEIAGRRWPMGRSGQVFLASAPGSLTFDSPHPFTLDLLADSESLYAGYRRRLWLTAALILSAALTAFLGLASLWRGFQRQARLSGMKSNFVSSVSHELRAPIAAVRLMAESLEQGRISGEAKQREYFRLIVQECRRLSTLVENVLDFSRIDQGRKRYVFEPVDLMALVRHTVALMQPCAAERKVALTLEDLPAEAAGLEPSWDHQAVEQSLVNLLDNAIKHSPPGAEVKVRMETGAGRVRLWVEDRGPGIPPEAQARIFDLFYRHGSELRRETKGAGIGLSIVKHVAEAHGGRVVVESAVGEGSRFALELPVNGGAK
jgi:signal transduction histidine kinase